jgi:DNA-binding response OmpR family regulator
MAMASPNAADASGPAVISLGNLSLNLENFRVAIGGELVDVTYHELELLRIFLDNPNRILSYESLARQIWGNAERLTTRHLNVLVHRLRLKLTGSHPYVIETVRGRGYGLLKSREVEDSNAWS